MLINPAGLYGGAAFRVDNTPLYNFAYRLQAKEQAKSEAIDKYYKDLANKATDTGVRPQDQNIFYDAKKDYQDFYIKNQDLLAKGDVAARMKAEELAKIPFQIAAASRDQFAIDQKIGTALVANPDLQKRWTKKTFDDFNASSAPVYARDPNTGIYAPNPQYKPFDPSRITTTPKQIDLAQAWVKISKDLNINPDEVIVGTKPSKRKFHQIVQKQFVLSPTNAKVIGDYAKTLYDTDEASEYSFKLFTKDMTPQQMQADPNMAVKFNDLNEAYKKAYGADIQDEKDLFAAYAISQNETKNIKEEEQKDDVAWYNYTKAKDFAYSKKLADYNAKLQARMKREAPTVNIATVRTSLEDIPDGKYGAFTKKGDIWYDASGNKLNSASNRFDVVIPANAIPGDLLKDVPASQRVAVSKIRLNVVNGVAQGAIDDDPDNPIFKATSRGSLVQGVLKNAGVKTAPATIQGGTAAPTGTKYGF